MGWAKNFRRAKSEWLSAIFSGPLGPGIPKIEAGAAPPPRLTLPSQRSRFVFCVGATARVARKPSPLGEGAERSEADEVGRGGTPGRPQAFPLQGGRWHGEAVTDEGGFLKRGPHLGGSPKGFPYPNSETPHSIKNWCRITPHQFYRFN